MKTAHKENLSASALVGELALTSAEAEVEYRNKSEHQKKVMTHRHYPWIGVLGYFFGPRYGTGAFLDGGKTYKLTVPGPVPGKLFWSVTVYDVNTRCLIATDQDRAAVRSHLDKPLANADGSFDIYFGPGAPAGKEGLWIKTLPGKGWFSTFRIYGPQAPAFDGTWKVNDMELVELNN